MTKPVKRYGFAMTEREYGAYVSVTDYDDLLAERDELRAALDTVDGLASARAAENERLGRRVHELEDELARIIGVRDGAALVIEQHLLDLKLDAERYRAMRDIVVNESAMNPDQYDAEADRLIGYAATQSQQAKP